MDVVSLMICLHLRLKMNQTTAAKLVGQGFASTSSRWGQECVLLDVSNISVAPSKSSILHPPNGPTNKKKRNSSRIPLRSISSQTRNARLHLNSLPSTDEKKSGKGKNSLTPKNKFQWWALNSLPRFHL